MTESFLKLLLFVQLEKVESLHELNACLFDDQLYEIDLNSISISQLSHRLNRMNLDIFQGLFLDLVSQIHTQTHYPKLHMPLKIIDSTILPLNLTNHRWTVISQNKSGCKSTFKTRFYGKRNIPPQKNLLTNAKEHDCSQLVY